MSLNLSFFKKSFITGSALAIAAGAAIAFFAHANAINNNQTLTHGAGYVLTVSSNQDKLTKVSPDSEPKNLPCLDNSKPTAFCRCPDNQSAFCKCLKLSDDSCKFCLPNHPNACFWCPPHGIMIACRAFDDNDSNSTSSITPQGSVSNPGIASTDPAVSDQSSGYSSPSQPTNNSGGNTTGFEPADPLPQNNSGASCPTPTHPMQDRPCFFREPSQGSGSGVCTPQRPCSVQ